MRGIVPVCFVAALMGLATRMCGQNRFVIDTIIIEGNKHTKDYIVLRELNIKAGDSVDLESWGQCTQANCNLLQNTSIILNAEFHLLNVDSISRHADLKVIVQEAWFVYPAPIFELADRNFNVWWVEQKRSINRINVGLKTYHTNLTGNRDRLKLLFQTGYTRKLELDYTFPYINKQKTLGMSTNFLFSRNREVSYNTINNQLVFYNDESRFLAKRYRAGLSFFYRPDIMDVHMAGITYNDNYVDPFVAESLNPEYFGNGRTRQRYLSLFARYTHDERDIRPYPENGYYASISLEKDGLGTLNDFEAFFLSPTVAYYSSINKRWISESIFSAQINLDRKPVPYNQNRALGYTNNFIRGYEYYVIDGTDYAYAKNSLKFKLFDRKFNIGRVVKLRQFRVIPFKAFLTANFDIGYVNNEEEYFPEHTLSNSVLVGGGLGLNIVILYGMVLQVEYSWNGKGENGLFLHGKTNF